MELRNLKAQDLGIVCKILSGIGVKEFKGCIENIDIKSISKEKNLEKIGVAIAFEIGGIVLEHIPTVQKDVDTFLASLTGKNIKDIQEMEFADYGELIITVVRKEEFKDFFIRAWKLFNP